MSLEEIYNFRRVDERVVTGGQPTEEQLGDVAAAGVEAVVNIATDDPRYSLDDEQATVTGLDMVYHHVPVDWDAPTAEDYAAFSKIMDELADRQVLVHCAANFRVTAFYSLYGMEKLGWSAAEADAFIAATWTPAEYEPWPGFIESRRAEFTQE